MQKLGGKNKNFRNNWSKVRGLQLMMKALAIELVNGDIII